MERCVLIRTSSSTRRIAFASGLLLALFPAAERAGAAGVEIYRRDFQKDGKAATYVKIYDPASRRLEAGILQPDGSLVPEALAPAPAGKVGPLLEERLRSNPGRERISVVLWLDVPPPSRVKLPESPARFDKAAFAREQEASLAAHAEAKGRALKSLELLPEELGGSLTATPLVFARVTAERLQKLLAREAVAFAEIREELRSEKMAPRSPSPAVKPSLDATGMSDLHARGLRGGSTGKLAIWEAGRCIDSFPVDWAAEPGGTPCDMHANSVVQVAASFDLVSDLGDATYDKIFEEDALDRAVRDLRPFVVVNQSEASYYHLQKDFPKNAYPNGADHWIDSVATGTWSVQFTLAAGNGMGGGYVLHHSFNSLKVGDSKGGTSWKNPHSAHGDRELPEIGAPSSPPGGSSLAAPAVAGTLTVLQEYHGAMVLPMFARAVLLAGAWRQVDPGPSWFEDVMAGRDRKAGAGELNARESYEILVAAGSQTPGLPGGDRGGWWGVSFDPGDGTKHEKDYPFRLSGTGTAAFRAALAWDQRAHGARGWGGWDLSDLDFLLLDDAGRIVGRSTTLDNNYELIESRIDRGRTYTLRILGSGVPKDGGVVFGLAWTSRE